MGVNWIGYWGVGGELRGGDLTLRVSNEVLSATKHQLSQFIFYWPNCLVNAPIRGEHLRAGGKSHSLLYYVCSLYSHRVISTARLGREGGGGEKVQCA